MLGRSDGAGDASVDRNVGAVDLAGAWAGEKGNGVGDIFGSPEPTDWVRGVVGGDLRFDVRPIDV